MNDAVKKHERREALAISLTNAGLAGLFAALLLHIGVVAVYFAGHPLAWSWLVQLAAVAFGVTLGVVIGTISGRRDVMVLPERGDVTRRSVFPRR